MPLSVFLLANSRFYSPPEKGRIEKNERRSNSSTQVYKRACELRSREKQRKKEKERAVKREREERTAASRVAHSYFNWPRVPSYLSRPCRDTGNCKTIEHTLLKIWGTSRRTRTFDLRSGPRIASTEAAHFALSLLISSFFF